MITLVTIAHNEADRIVDHLDRAAVYCDEMIVVVQDSDDDTAELVEDYPGATLLRDECHGCAEPSRDLAISAVTTDWVMYLDADEHLGPDKIEYLPHIMEKYHSALLSVGAWIDGERLHDLPDRQMRFFQPDKVVWGDTNHSRFEPRFEFWSTPSYVYRSQGGPWIYNMKSGAEAAVDEARYARLGR